MDLVTERVLLENSVIREGEYGASAIVIASLAMCVWHMDPLNQCELTGETRSCQASCRAGFLPSYKAG